MTKYVRLVLRERPTGPVEDRHFEAVESDLPTPTDGQAVVRTCWLAFAPAQRGYLNDLPSYAAPVGIGDVMRATGAGQVVASRHPDYADGDLVMRHPGRQEPAPVRPASPRAATQPLPPRLHPK